MSKKEMEINEGAAMEAAKVNQLTAAIDAAIEAGTITEHPSLKAIAAVFDVSPTRIYSVAKQPKEGEVYDARVYNWDAIERFVVKRLDEGQTMEDVVAAAIDKDVEFKTADRRTGRRLSDEEKYVKCSNGLMPKRKYSIEIGQKVLTKKDKGIVYEVVYMTDTHIVLQAEGTTELKVFANWTANSQLIPPSRFEETLAARQAEAEAAVSDEEAAQ